MQRLGFESLIAARPGPERDAVGAMVAKIFALSIEDQRFEFKRLDAQIAAEAALGGIYIIRTGVPKKQVTSAEAVRSYKALADVERAFRSTHALPDGSAARSFRILVQELPTIVRNTCQPSAGTTAVMTFQMTTIPNRTQQRALQLLQSVTA